MHGIDPQIVIFIDVHTASFDLNIEIVRSLEEKDEIDGNRKNCGITARCDENMEELYCRICRNRVA